MEVLRPDAQNALCGEILAEARRESEEILHRARNEAEALLARTAVEADRARQERLDLARAEAARRRELILATVPVEAGRQRLAHIEALLQTIEEQARRRLVARQDFDYRATLIALAVEAIRCMAGEAFIIRLSPSDHVTLSDGLAGEITRCVGRSPLSITLSDDPTIAEGGLIIQDVQGRQAWDNRLPTRLERLWPELRRQIALDTLLVAGSTPTRGGL